MNKQNANAGIEWTHIFGPGSGYTWNPVGGCPHQCRWVMPDGSVAKCYAELIAERLAVNSYPGGFKEHYWRPDELDAPDKLREPAGIFLDSMSDLMAARVPVEHIRQVLAVVARNPQHVFFLLTKNAPRLRHFTLPRNLWTGVSMPPSQMFGSTLTADQQRRYVMRALWVLAQIDVPVRWMSFEPLSFDVAPLIWEWVDETPFDRPPLEWAVIGAASNGPKTYQPDTLHTTALIDLLDAAGLPMFFKGNLEWSPWREEFPKWSTEPVQLGLGL